MALNKKTKIILLIVACVVGGNVVFASFVLTFFNKVQNNPTTALVSRYIYNNAEFEEKYGEVTSVNHRVFDKEEKTDDYMSVSYSIETEKTDRYIVYFTIEKENDEWIVTGFEVVEKE